MSVIQTTPKEEQKPENDLFSAACSIVSLFFQYMNLSTEQYALKHEEEKILCLKAPIPSSQEDATSHFDSIVSKETKEIKVPSATEQLPSLSIKEGKEEASFQPKTDPLKMQEKTLDESTDEKISLSSNTTLARTHAEDSYALISMAKKEMTTMIEKDMEYLKEAGLGALIELNTDASLEKNPIKLAIENNDLVAMQVLYKKFNPNQTMKNELLHCALDQMENCDTRQFMIRMHSLLKIIIFLLEQGADATSKKTPTAASPIYIFFNAIRTTRFDADYGNRHQAKELVNKITEQLLEFPLSKEDLYFVIQTIIHFIDGSGLFLSAKCHGLVSFSQKNIQTCMQLQSSIIQNNFSDKIKFLMLCLNSSLDEELYKSQINFKRNLTDRSHVDNQTLFDFMGILINKNKQALCEQIRFKNPQAWLHFVVYSEQADLDKANIILAFCKNNREQVKSFMENPINKRPLQKLMQRMLLRKIKNILIQDSTPILGIVIERKEALSLEEYALLKSNNLLCKAFTAILEKYLPINTSINSEKNKSNSVFTAKLTQKACIEMMVENFVHFPEMSMLFANLYMDPYEACYGFPRFLSHMSNQGLAHIVTTAMNSTAHAQEFAKALALQKINLSLGGCSVDNYSSLATHLISRAPIPLSLKSLSESKLIRDIEKACAKEIKEEKKSESSLLADLKKEGWEFLRLQGRTIIMKHANGKRLAIKIQKENENPSELKKEYYSTMLEKDKAQELKLKTKFPTPRYVGDISTSFSELFQMAKTEKDKKKFDDFVRLIGDKPKNHAYIYETDNESYFKYLNDPTLSNEEFTQANQDIIDDLCTLYEQGSVCAQPIDMFHDTSDSSGERLDKGRYIVLTNLLHNLSPTSTCIVGVTPYPFGSGRVTNWKGAAEFPNFRLTGLADVGDSIKLSDLDSNAKRTETLYRSAKINHGKKTGNVLVLNILAEYQYSLFLVAGRRAYFLDQQTSSKEAKLQIWRKTAQQVLANCAQMLARLSGITKKHAHDFLSACIDIERLTKQMQFWMTSLCLTNASKNLYGPNVNLIHEDPITDSALYNLGPESGQEPIKEFNLLLYMMVIGLAGQYHKQQLTKSVAHEEKKDTALNHLPIYQKIKTQLIFDMKHAKKMHKRIPIDGREAKTDFLFNPNKDRLFTNRRKLIKAHTRCRKIIRINNLNK